jgi:hypothetical protein
MGIDEGEEVKAKGIGNILYKVIEKLPNLEKEMPIQLQESFRTQQTRPEWNFPTAYYS